MLDKSWEDEAASLPLGERKRKEWRETPPLDLFIYLRKYRKDYKKLLNAPGVLPSHMNYGPYHKFNLWNLRLCEREKVRIYGTLGVLYNYQGLHD